MAIRREINFFEKTYISSTSFNINSPISWTFTSVGIALVVESNDSTDVVEYSFNGVDVHGDMTPLTPTEAIIFDNRAHGKIWFRRSTPGDPVLVRVEAWRYEA